MHLSMLSPRGGGGGSGICGAFDFSDKFSIKSPTVEQKNLINCNHNFVRKLNDTIFEKNTQVDHMKFILYILY